MRRLLALILALTLLLGATPAAAINTPAASVKGVRILVDGKIYTYDVPSGYDAMLNGAGDTGPLVPVLKDTSTVLLSPNSYDSGRTITINPDVTYTTLEIFV